MTAVSCRCLARQMTSRPTFSWETRPAPTKSTQMKGQGRGGYAETSLDVADLHPVETRPYQQPIDIQPGEVAEFGQALSSEFAVHDPRSNGWRRKKRNYIPSVMG